MFAFTTLSYIPLSMHTFKHVTGVYSRSCGSNHRTHERRWKLGKRGQYEQQLAVLCMGHLKALFTIEPK